MKKRCNKIFGWIISGMLSLLGFSSCDIIPDMPLEYGTPNANYTVKGKVTDHANKPIQGIEVTIKRSGLPVDDPFNSKTLASDTKGEFSNEFKGEFPRDIVFTLTFTDIDGVQNGEFNTKQESVEIKSSELKGRSSGWFAGSATKEVTVKLDSK